MPRAKHNGLIITIKHGDEGYLDIFIKEKETGAEILAGSPKKVTEKIALGQFLTKMGVELKVGSKVDLQKALLRREVTFLSIGEEIEV